LSCLRRKIEAPKRSGSAGEAYAALFKRDADERAAEREHGYGVNALS
jgi:hypothetical protein